MSQPSLIFAGGATGGHIYPGIAVADCWVKQYPNSRPVFIGNGRKIEADILAETAYQHEAIPFESPRTITKRPVQFLKNWRASTRLAHELLSRYRPDAVIGLGGFACYPTIREAARAQIPILLLEQNVVPGRSTAYLSKWADCVCVTYEQTKRYLSKHPNIRTTGNPLREDIIQVSNDNQYNRTPSSPILLIQGGSQGSTVINRAVMNYLNRYKETLKGWEIRHQTGNINDKIIDELRTQYERAGIKADVRPYFSSATALYRLASLVVCRAGGTTLSELRFLHLPALIVPIANSIRNHQVKNAIEHLKHHEGAIVAENPRNTREFQNRFDLELQRRLESHKTRNQASKTFNKGYHEDPASLLVVQAIKELIASQTG